MGANAKFLRMRGPLPPQLIDKLLRVGGFENYRMGISKRREKYQKLAAAVVQANRLSVRNTEPAGLVTGVCEPVGAYSGPPIGIRIDIHDANARDIHICRFHRYRVETVVNQLVIRRYRAARKTWRIENREGAERYPGSHNDGHNELRQLAREAG